MPAVFLVGHGSRNPVANQEFESLAALYAQQAAVDVGLGYIELAEPGLEAGLDAIARRAREVSVMPLMLFKAGHVKHDVQEAVQQARQRHPFVTFRVAEPLGVHAIPVQVARRRAAVASPADQTPQAETIVLFVGRGSSDPDANGDLYKTARLFSEGRRDALVQPAFMGATDPSVARGLEIVARLAPRDLLVVPYLLFAGVLLAQLRAAIDEFARSHPEMRVRMSGHLGPDPDLCRLIQERILAAEAE